MTKIIKREIFDDLIAHLGKKEATLLVGPRQAGKTTLLLLIKKHLIEEKKIDPENIFYFNLDRFKDLEFFSSQEEVIKFLESREKKGKIYLFIDEAQRIKEAGRFLKGIYDLNFNLKMIVSGSSSLEIKSKIVEPLTGRKRVFHLYSFSFKEFLRAKDPSLIEIAEQEEPLSLYDRNKLQNLLEEFLVFGGYPSVVLEENPKEKEKILEEIYNSYLEKDIISFLAVKKPFVFKKLAGLLAFQVGQLVNLNEISRSLSAERRTIENYIDILKETFVIKNVLPFYRNARKELVKMPKVFFLDNGLRNFAINNLERYPLRQDQGGLLENFVASEIIKSDKLREALYFWRTHHGAEVDFVLRRAGRVVPIEVKKSLKSAKIPRGLHHFLVDYPCRKSWVINMDIEKEIILSAKKEIKVILLPPYKIKRILSEL